MSRFMQSGYAGQRYEILYTDVDSGEQKVFGWCNDSDGGPLAKSIELNPSMEKPLVVDLKAKYEGLTYKQIRQLPEEEQRKAFYQNEGECPIHLDCRCSKCGHRYAVNCLKKDSKVAGRVPYLQGKEANPMLILSFGRTTAALLAGEKSVTRREWTDSTFAMWHRRQSEDFQCWSKSPRCGGKKIAIARLVSVDWERTCKIPDSDWKAEGFAYMVDHGIRLDKELQVSECWQRWREDPELVTAVVRFDNVRPLEGFTPEMFWPTVRSG